MNKHMDTIQLRFNSVCLNRLSCFRVPFSDTFLHSDIRVQLFKTNLDISPGMRMFRIDQEFLI